MNKIQNLSQLKSQQLATSKSKAKFGISAFNDTKLNNV